MEVFLTYILFAILLNINLIKTEEDIKLFNKLPNQKFTSSDNSDYYDKIRGYLNEIKLNPDLLKNTLLKNFVSELNDFFDYYNMSFFIPVINDLFLNEMNSFINDTYSLLQINNSGIYALDYIIEIGDYINRTSDIDINEIFYILQKFLNFPGTDYLFNILLRHNETIFYFYESLINKTDTAKLFVMFKSTFWQYKEILIEFGYELLLEYNDTDELVKIACEFYNKYIYSFWTSFLSKMDENVYLALKDLLRFKNRVVEDIKNQILIYFFSPTTIFTFLKYRETYEIIFNVLKRYKNIKLLLSYIPDALNKFNDLCSNSDIFLENICKFIKARLHVLIHLELDEFIYFITFDVTESIKKYLTNEKLFENDFSPDCTKLLNTALFSKKLLPTYFYFKKMSIDSTKNKNDFLTYEN